MDGIKFDNAELVCATPLIDKDIAKFFNVTKIIDGGRPGSILQIAPKPELLADLMERTFQRLGPIGGTPVSIDEAISNSKQGVGIVDQQQLESLHLYVSDCHPWRDVTRSVLLKTKFVYKSRFPQMKLVSEYKALPSIKRDSKKKHSSSSGSGNPESSSPSAKIPFQKSPWDFSLDEWSSAIASSNNARSKNSSRKDKDGGDENPFPSSFGAFSPGLTEMAAYSRLLQTLLLARRDQILGILTDGSVDHSSSTATSSSSERYDNNTLKYVPFGQVVALDLCPLSNDIRGIIMTYHGDDNSEEEVDIEKPSPLLSDPLEGERVIHRAYHFMLQCGVAVGHMHASGIVHLDIKPDNILVASDACILKVGHCKQSGWKGDDSSSSYHSKQVFKLIDFDCARFSASSPLLVSALRLGGGGADDGIPNQKQSPKITVNHSYISAGRRKFGSPGHTSPEYHVLNHGMFNAQAYDMFAFGSTAASLAINGEIFDSGHVQPDDFLWHQWLLINDFLGKSSIPSKFRLPTLKSITGAIVGGSAHEKKTIQSPAIHDDATIVAMLPLWLHPALYCSKCIGKTASLLCGVADEREAIAADTGEDDDSEEYDVDEREPYVDIIASQSSTLFGSGNKWSAGDVQKQIADYSKIQTSNLFYMKHIIRANSLFRRSESSRNNLFKDPSSGCIGCYSCDALANEDGSLANSDIINLPNRLFELHVLHNMLGESSNITSTSKSSSSPASDSFDSSEFIKCIDHCIMRDVEDDYKDIDSFNPPDFIMHYILCMINQRSEEEEDSSSSYSLSSGNLQWPSSQEFDNLTTIKSKMMYNEWWTLLCEFVAAYEMKVSSTLTVSAASSSSTSAGSWMTGVDIQLSSPVHRFCYRIAINTLNLSKTVRHAMKSRVSERPSALDIMNNDIYKLISQSCHLLINDNLDSSTDSSKLREESSAITNFAPHVSKTYREIGAYGFYKRFSFDPSRMEQLFLPEEDKISEMCPHKNPPLHQCESFMSDVASQFLSIQSQVNSTPSLSSLNINIAAFISGCKSKCNLFKRHLIAHFWYFIKNTPPRVCERIVGKGEATLLSMINENTVQPGLLYAMEMFRVLWSEEMEHMWLNYSATDEFAENVIVCLQEYASSIDGSIPSPSDLEGVIAGSFHLHSGMIFDFLIDMCMVFGACLIHATQIFAHDATESMNLIAFYAQQYMVRITTMEFARSGHPVASAGADRLYFVGRLDMLKMVNDDNYTAPSAIRDDESQSIQNEGIAIMSSPAPSNLSLPSFWLDDPVEENSIPFVDIPGRELGRHASRTRRQFNFQKRRSRITKGKGVDFNGEEMESIVERAKDGAKDANGMLLSGWHSVSASAEEGIINALPSSLAEIISKSSSSSSSHHDKPSSSAPKVSDNRSGKVVKVVKGKDYFDESDNTDDKFSLVPLASDKRRDYVDSHRRLFCDDDQDDDDGSDDSYSVSSCSSSSSSGSVSSGDDDSTRLWALPRSHIKHQKLPDSTASTHQLLLSSGHADAITTSTTDNQFKFTSRDSKQRRRSGYSTLPADSLTIDRIEDHEQSQSQSKYPSSKQDRFFAPDAYDDDDRTSSSSHSSDSEESSLDLLDVESDVDEDDIVVVLEKQRNAIASHFGSEYRELSSRLECALMMRFSGHYPIPQLLLWYEGCITQINASNIFITGKPLDLALVATLINKWMSSVSDFDSNIKQNKNNWASLFMVICYKVHCLTSTQATVSYSPSPLNLKMYSPTSSSDILLAFNEWSHDLIHDMISSTLLADALVERIQKSDDIVSSLLTAVGNISSQIVITTNKHVFINHH